MEIKPDLFQMLQMIQNNDTINLDDNVNEIANLINAMQKKQIINKHPYAISECKKHGETYFLTYVYDETKKNHRRQIVAKTKKDIENKICSIYKQEHTWTLDQVYQEWYSETYRIRVKPTTYARTKTDYDRFLKDTKLSSTAITKITPLIIENFIHNAIIDFKLHEQGCKNLKGLLNGIFKYAVKKGYLAKNPIELVEISTSNIQRTKRRSKEEDIFTLEERNLIKATIKSDMEHYKDSAPYAILLCFQLALRVSELVALKWSDIIGQTIHIQRQEVCYKNINGQTVHEIVDHTKSRAGDRVLALTPEALNILNDVKIWNEAHDINSEYIFASDQKPFFNRQRINTCLYSYCDKAKIIRKSAHKIRRSVLSSLLDNASNKDAIREFAGHEDIMTTYKSYYKNIISDETFYEEMCSCLN